MCLRLSEHGIVEDSSEVGVKTLGPGSHSASATKDHLASFSETLLHLL